MSAHLINALRAARCCVKDGSAVAQQIDAALAQAEAKTIQSPVAWKHGCDVIGANVELWIDRCPSCGKPRPTPQPAARVNEDGFLVECGDLPLAPGSVLYLGQPAAPECPRSELVIALHSLASDYENALGSFGGDHEARRKAEGDIAHAMKVASRHNYNGAGCRAAPAVQAGYKLVPEKITEAMHVAAVRTIIRCTGNDDFPQRVFRAMLAAAPEVK